MSCILSQLNILINRTSQKWQFTHFHRLHVTIISHVFQRIGFDRSRVIHLKKRSVLYLE